MSISALCLVNEMVLQRRMNMTIPPEESLARFICLVSYVGHCTKGCTSCFQYNSHCLCEGGHRAALCNQETRVCKSQEGDSIGWVSQECPVYSLFIDTHSIGVFRYSVSLSTQVGLWDEQEPSSWDISDKQYLYGSHLHQKCPLLSGIQILPRCLLILLIKYGNSSYRNDVVKPGDPAKERIYC